MPHSPKTTSWPNGRRAALSITFDDARESQLDVGLPVLDKEEVKSTFFVSVDKVKHRQAEWREVADAGHEIGNHSLSHPCSGNFDWSRHNALEDYTLERIQDDILTASAAIRNLLNVTPASFAYPCGQSFVGRGASVQSYVPVISRHFVVGRGFRDEHTNEPNHCDLAQVAGQQMDGLSAGNLRRLIDEVIIDGKWLILVAHDVSRPGHGGSLSVGSEELEVLCRLVREHEDILWTDTVSSIGAYLADVRRERSEQ